MVQIASRRSSCPNDCHIWTPSENQHGRTMLNERLPQKSQGPQTGVKTCVLRLSTPESKELGGMRAN